MGHGAKGNVKDSHNLQTMTLVYSATDNKLMYVCACGAYYVFLREYTSHGQVDGNCFETYCTKRCF